MHQPVCFQYVLRTMWCIVGDDVNRILALKELSIFKTLDLVTKYLKRIRDWLVN